MRLPAVPVTSFEDATLNAEALQTVLTKPGQSLPFLQLLTAQDLKFAFGASTATFSASSTATSTVAHGLGRVPAGAFCIPVLASGFLQYNVLGVPTSTSVTFSFTAGGAITLTFSFYWFAYG